eukprot:TRINITY_DN5583_c0_g2_i1.p1 TRINITY_DN5583_c0_g2~~TRINITY_DN5583_c0_g2_i1.p1  ORF type:complete len:885 (+),score=129.43 TRINITY_DN5583_c0_g2_i1:302-2656(+)
MLVFGGSSAGIQFSHLYQYYFDTMEWRVLAQYDVPLSRHVAIASQESQSMIILSGLSGRTFHDKIGIFSLSSMKWERSNTPGLCIKDAVGVAHSLIENGTIRLLLYGGIGLHAPLQPLVLPVKLSNLETHAAGNLNTAPTPPCTGCCVWVWKEGTLSHPSRATGVVNFNIRKMSANLNTTAFLTTEGKLLLMNTDHLFEPTLSMVPLTKLSVKQVALGLEKGVLLTSEGNVYMINLVEHTTPKQLSSLANGTFVAAGTHNFYAVTKEGWLFSWGSGLLGLEATTSGTPTLTQASTLGIVKAVCCSSSHAVALFRSGTVAGWGKMSALGKEGWKQLPVLLDSRLNFICKVACAENYTLYLTKDKRRLFSTGSLVEGQTIEPQIVELPPGTLIEDMACGNGMAALISTNGTTFLWGRSSKSGSQATSDSPQQPPCLLSPSPFHPLISVRVCEVACSGVHFLFRRNPFDCQPAMGIAAHPGGFCDIPPAVASLIADSLSTRDLCSLGSTCRHLHAVLALDRIWEQRVLKLQAKLESRRVGLEAAKTAVHTESDLQSIPTTFPSKQAVIQQPGKCYSSAQDQYISLQCNWKRWKSWVNRQKCPKAAQTGGLYKSLFPTSSMKVLLHGDGATGKTTLLYKLKLENNFACGSTIPTIGFNVETIRYRGFEITIWDVGGGCKIKPLVRHYFSEQTAVILMVDLSLEQQYSADQTLLHYLLSEELRTQHCPLMILCNKSDTSRRTVQDVIDHLDVEAIEAVFTDWVVVTSSLLRGNPHDIAASLFSLIFRQL